MTNNTASVCQLNDHRVTVKHLMLFVIVMRRIARQAVAAIEHERDKAHQYRRQARILKERANPFDAARIAALEALAADATTACRTSHDTINKCGKLLASAAPIIDAGTTLAQRCDILNVNIADRGGLTEADGLHRIIFAHGLEDSAARRGCEYNDGALYQASQRVFMDFLMNTKEGQKLGDSLFEPGGMLAGVPM